MREMPFAMLVILLVVLVLVVGLIYFFVQRWL